MGPGCLSPQGECPGILGTILTILEGKPIACLCNIDQSQEGLDPQSVLLVTKLELFEIYIRIWGVYSFKDIQASHPAYWQMSPSLRISGCFIYRRGIVSLIKSMQVVRQKNVSNTSHLQFKWKSGRLDWETVSETLIFRKSELEEFTLKLLRSPNLENS